MAGDPRGRTQADRAVDLMRRADLERTGTAGADIPARLAARALDTLLLLGLATVVFLSVSIATDSDEPRRPQVDPEREYTPISLVPAAPSAGTVAFISAGVALIVGYETLGAAFGGTPGRRRAGLRLVRFGTRDSASVFRVALRTFIWSAPLVIGIVSTGLSVLYPLGAFGMLAALFFWHRREPHGRPAWDVLAGTQSIHRV
jgi:uncharacterized RDD family membrane protein YckC